MKTLSEEVTNFGKDIKKDRYLESVKAIFLMMPSYRRFPKDDEFKREIMVRWNIGIVN